MWEALPDDPMHNELTHESTDDFLVPFFARVNRFFSTTYEYCSLGCILRVRKFSVIFWFFLIFELWVQKLISPFYGLYFYFFIRTG